MNYGKHVDLDIHFEIVAKNDALSDDPHYPSMGPGQQSGLKKLLRALEDWQKENR